MNRKQAEQRRVYPSDRERAEAFVLNLDAEDDWTERLVAEFAAVREEARCRRACSANECAGYWKDGE